MGRPLIELSGKRFGGLTVLARVGTSRNFQPLWRCRCECGTSVVRAGASLRSGNSTSCGCGKLAKIRKHGGKGTPEYRAWLGARCRCTNPRREGWKNYGGRGITFSPAFNHFNVFLQEVGLRPSPGHSLDRIDNSRGYEPGNVRWATRHEQNSNKRPSRFCIHGHEFTEANTYRWGGSRQCLACKRLRGMAAWRAK